MPQGGFNQQNDSVSQDEHFGIRNNVSGRKKSSIIFVRPGEVGQVGSVVETPKIFSSVRSVYDNCEKDLICNKEF